MAAHIGRLTNALPGQAIRTQGIVIAVELAGPRGRPPGYAPVVSFRDEQGSERRFLSGTTYNPPAHREGDRVPVIYRKGEPQTASIDEWIGRFLGPSMLAGFGLIVGLLGLATLRGAFGQGEPRR